MRCNTASPVRPRAPGDCHSPHLRGLLDRGAHGAARTGARRRCSAPSPGRFRRRSGSRPWSSTSTGPRPTTTGHHRLRQRARPRDAAALVTSRGQLGAAARSGVPARAASTSSPQGALDWSIEQPASYVPDLSRPADDVRRRLGSDDALFVTFEGAGRQALRDHLGRRAEFRPPPRRPASCDVLTAFAAHAGLAIESSRHVTELGAALARHRAVIQSSLDCVIAIDGVGPHPRVQPCRRADVRIQRRRRDWPRARRPAGAADSRHGRRRALRRAIDRCDAELLGRPRSRPPRCVPTAARLPVELSLTVVRGSRTRSRSCTASCATSPSAAAARSSSPTSPTTTR